MKRLKSIFRLVKLSIRIAAALGCVLFSMLIVRSYYVGQDVGARVTFTRAENPNAIDSTLIQFDRGYLFCGVDFSLREVLPVSMIPRATQEERGLIGLGPPNLYITSRDFLQFYFASRLNPYKREDVLNAYPTDHFLGLHWDARLASLMPPALISGDGLWASEGDYNIFLAFPAWLLLIPGVLIAQPWKFISVIRKKRRRSKNLCPACGYDTRANPGRCSECGAAIS